MYMYMYLQVHTHTGISKRLTVMLNMYVCMYVCMYYTSTTYKYKYNTYERMHG